MLGVFKRGELAQEPVDRDVRGARVEAQCDYLLEREVGKLRGHLASHARRPPRVDVAVCNLQKVRRPPPLVVRVASAWGAPLTPHGWPDGGVPPLGAKRIADPLPVDPIGAAVKLRRHAEGRSAHELLDAVDVMLP